MIASESADGCFCCAEGNPDGLHLSFTYPEPGVSTADLTIPIRFRGWRRMTHGGFLSMLLDETMAHALASLELEAVTAELSVRYRHPVEVGSEIRLTGTVESRTPRIFRVAAEISLIDGPLIASGHGRFFKPDHSA